MGRRENVEAFEDTQRLYSTNTVLKEAVQSANQKQQLYQEDVEVEGNIVQRDKPARIVVSKKRTLEAASAYVGKKVCILNFASATNPGGGVVKGSSAQEEAICRCSTLYPNLNEPKMWNGFYRPHRQELNPLHNDDCIYTPGVIAFKSDTDYPQMLPLNRCYKVNVITCAAPNLREKPSNVMNSGDGDMAVKISNDDLQELHEKRMRRVLEITAKKGNDVVILGAFGCGAFRNPPEVVERAMKTVVEEYRNAFETIEFAVYCSPRDDSNYRTFKEVLG